VKSGRKVPFDRFAAVPTTDVAPGLTLIERVVLGYLASEWTAAAEDVFPVGTAQLAEDIGASRRAVEGALRALENEHHLIQCVEPSAGGRGRFPRYRLSLDGTAQDVRGSGLARASKPRSNRERNPAATANETRHDVRGLPDPHLFLDQRSEIQRESVEPRALRIGVGETLRQGLSKNGRDVDAQTLRGWLSDEQVETLAGYDTDALASFVTVAVDDLLEDRSDWIEVRTGDRPLAACDAMIRTDADLVAAICEVAEGERPTSDEDRVQFAFIDAYEGKRGRERPVSWWWTENRSALDRIAAWCAGRRDAWHERLTRGEATLPGPPPPITLAVELASGWWGRSDAETAPLAELAANPERYLSSAVRGGE
jgi:hypothetical protein